MGSGKKFVEAEEKMLSNLKPSFLIFAFIFFQLASWLAVDGPEPRPHICCTKIQRR
jgi:hypothetical protein